MKTWIQDLFIALGILSSISNATAQGTAAFTYQGQLRDGGTNASGNYSMTFKLYDAATNGNQIGNTLAGNLSLANGLFSVNLDFGAGVFGGAARWLDITIQAGTNAPETLSPRVQVMPAPYALYSAVAGTVTNHAINNTLLATNAVATTNIQNNAITTVLIADGAVTNRNLATNAVAAFNIQNNAVSDAKIVSINGSKVTGGVALATNASYAELLSSTILTYINSNWVTAHTWTAGSVQPDLYDFTIAGSGGARLAIHTNGGVFGNGIGLTNVPGVPKAIEIIFASGTFVVPSNVTRIMIEVIGGGGGGGNGFFDLMLGANPGGGGGGGGTLIHTMSVTPGTSYAVTIGGGGSPGQAGTNTTFGGVLVAQGGAAGGNATSTEAGPGGAGGGGSGTTLIAKGQDGAEGFSDLGLAGNGGGTLRGGRGGYGHPFGRPNAVPLPHSREGVGPGSGGGGGGGVEDPDYRAGGKGSGGGIIIYY